MTTRLCFDRFLVAILLLLWLPLTTLAGRDGDISLLVNLEVERSQALFGPAYGSNGTGHESHVAVRQTRYQHHREYYGYFDAVKCYRHRSGRFIASETIRVDSVGRRAYCSGGQWHGNFLNWLAMSRLDLLRRFVYGGSRRVDMPTETVLSGSWFPGASGRWVKFYGASEIERALLPSLTPFDGVLVSQGLSFCRGVARQAPDRLANGVERGWRPVLRVARGAHWSSIGTADGCVWAEDSAALNAPRFAVDAIGAKEYQLEVLACWSGWLGEEPCQRAGQGPYQPVGIVQRYAGNGARFALASDTGADRYDDTLHTRLIERLDRLEMASERERRNEPHPLHALSAADSAHWPSAAPAAKLCGREATLRFFGRGDPPADRSIGRLTRSLAGSGLWLEVPDPVTSNVSGHWFLGGSITGSKTAAERTVHTLFAGLAEQFSPRPLGFDGYALSTASVAFQTVDNVGFKSGDLRAFGVGGGGHLSGPVYWSAVEALSATKPDQRTMISYDHHAAEGLALRWSVLTAQNSPILARSLDRDGRGARRLAYWRGDRSNEGDFVGAFARRVSVIGQIGTSRPVFVGQPSAHYPEVLAPGYFSFRKRWQRREPVVYVVSSRGWLQGFGVGALRSDGHSAEVAGERLVYLPGSEILRRTEKTPEATKAVERAVLETTPMVADARINERWRSILVAPSGHHAQGYYALDITDPQQFAEYNAKSIALWEFTDADDADLGYSLNRPHWHQFTGQSRQIVKMNNDQWAVVLGNGYHNTANDDYYGACSGHSSTPCVVSQTGEAVLYVLFIERGIDGWQQGDFVKLHTGMGTDAQGHPNGMATPRGVDVDGDLRIDVIYAGDLRGNLWKFDVSASDPARWLSGRIVFRAGRAILTAPEITPNPYSGGALYPISSLQILFGTGTLQPAVAGSQTPEIQTVYGIWDRFERLGSPLEVPAGALVHQQLVETEIDGQVFRTIRAAPTRYRFADPRYPHRAARSAQDAVQTLAEDETHLGWALDLAGPGHWHSGERMVHNPELRYGRLWFTTHVPNRRHCQDRGASWLMSVDYLTGAAVSGQPAFDVNGDGRLDIADWINLPSGQTNRSGRRTVTGIRTDHPKWGDVSGLTTLGAGNLVHIYLNRYSGLSSHMIGGENAEAIGRMSWREIFE